MRAAPTSPGQRALWVAWKRAPGASTWNNAAAFQVDGPLDVARLRASWQALLTRHVALGGRYRLVEGELIREPLASLEASVAVLSGPPVDLAARAQAPFDLEQGPVARLTCWRVAPERHVLLGVIHHLASDGPSLAVLVEELSALMRGEPLPPLTVTWDDAVSRLRAAPRPAPAPPGPALGEGVACSVPVSGALRVRVRQRAASLGVTEATLWQAAFRAWGFRLTGEASCAVPMVGRTRREWRVVGYFTEPVEVAAEPAGDERFSQWIQRVDEATRLARRAPQVARAPWALFNMLPFEPVPDLPGARVTPLALPLPLGQAGLALTVRVQGEGAVLEFGAGDARISPWLEEWCAGFPGLISAVCAAPTLALSEFPLISEAPLGGSTAVLPLGTALRGSASGYPDVTKQPPPHREAGALQPRFLAPVACQVERPGSAAPPDASAGSADQVQARGTSATSAANTGTGANPGALSSRDTGPRSTGQLESPGSGAPRPATGDAGAASSMVLSGHRQGQEERTPPRGPAVPRRSVRGDGGPLLDFDVQRAIADQARANPDAPALVDLRTGATWTRGRLRDETAARAETLRALPHPGVVALHLTRGPAAVAWMLACFDAGCAWWFPGEAALEPLRPIATVREPGGPHDLTPRDGDVSPGLAFALLTSGTTGPSTPVRVRRAPVESYVAWFARHLGLTSEDRVLQFHALHFDGHVEEVLPTLAAGATLVLRAALPDARQWVSLVEEQRLTVCSLPTGYFNAAMAALSGLSLSLPETLRACVVGGEALSPRARDAFAVLAPQARLINTYGPAEATIAVCVSDDERLGRPLPGVRVAVVDEGGRPLPGGVVGRLIIGGETLAQGVEAPFAPGDLAAWDAAGQLAFHGRTDAQVKWRGVRLDLEELEQRLSTAGLSPVVVRVVEGALQVWALGTELGRVRSAVRALPLAVRPSRGAVLETWPLTPSGKTDLASVLAVPTTPLSSPGRPPEDDAERAVCAAFAQVLRLSAVGAEDDFYELGGDSLRGLELCVRLESALGRVVSLAEVEEHRTPAALAHAAAPAPAWGEDVRLLEGWTPPQGRREGLQAPATEATTGSPPAVSPGGASPSLPPRVEPSGDALITGAADLLGTHPTPPHLEPTAGPALITGATGFLGAHMLQAWLAQPGAGATCLVRATTQASATERLRAHLASLKLEVDWSRVTVVAGNLRAPPAGPWSVVLHAAASTALGQTYQALRESNVLGTAGILRLGRPTLIISTAGAEQGDTPPAWGYPASKWVADRLAREARSRGAPVWIARPGRLWASRRTGVPPAHDALWRSVVAGAVPLELAAAQCEAVDDFADALVAWLRSSPPGDFVHAPGQAPLEVWRGALISR